jgi:hypothetical protein
VSVISIKTGQSLKAFLTSVIDESIKSTLHQRALQEKDKQDSASKATGDEAEQEKPEGDSAESAPISDEERDALKKGEVAADDVIEKLNSIRSGKSFRDESVKSNMEKYVEGLSKAERTALLAFLKGISQIVTGDIPAQSSMHPAENPADVKMKKGDTVQKKSIKPNVIKTQIPSTSKKPSAEDTSGPVPITPKKK